MNNTILNKHIRDQMHFGEQYSFAKMEAVYNDVMNEDEFLDYPKLSIKSLHNRLSEWSTAGGWLRKSGTGKDARFWKDEPECKLSKYYDKAMQLYASAKEPRTWWR